MNYKLLIIIPAILLTAQSCTVDTTTPEASQNTRETMSENSELVRVESVIDADTVHIPGDRKVRLLGIDAPEKGECYYDESRQQATEFLEDKDVIIEKEISGTDIYGRLLRYIILPGDSPEKDNILVNDYLVRQGLAIADGTPPDNRYRDLLISAQEEAIREDRGLWDECGDIYKADLSDRREGDDEPPTDEHIIKGNISTRGYGKTYLFPGCDNYETVKIDLDKGEQFFRSVEEAEEAGFREATNCP